MREQNISVTFLFSNLTGAPSYPAAAAMETHAVFVLLTNFCAELRNPKTFFSINNFAENLLFKAILPVNDILSDFIVADNHRLSHHNY